MKNRFKNLTVLNNLTLDPAFGAFCAAAENEELFPQFLNKLFLCGGENDFTGYVEDLILYDENAFSVACAGRKKPSPYLVRAFCEDLKIICDGLRAFDGRGAFCMGETEKSRMFGRDPQDCAAYLSDYYAKHGYGMFLRNKAFGYEDENLAPISETSPITLGQLKNYAYEKRVMSENIESFLRNLPYSNMLLYGDRGTGKSSTVHAMLNRYSDEGLRLVELNKENVLSIPRIKRLLSGNPLKFIIFIDDLSFSEYDDKISSLKASLEGSVSNGADNVMIVATSNRRHIVKESFSDRDNSVHPADSMSEQLSLSDRFGLTVNFSTTDKSEYLDIVLQLARDRGLKTPHDRLTALAERWALIKGGRSPRRAKQFADIAYACEQKGIEIEF